MNRLSILDWVALIVVVIGGLNWALVGAIKFNLVSFLFGDMSVLSRIIYIIVGLAAIYLITIAPKLSKS